MPDNWYVLFCRTCDREIGPMPIPFQTPQERGKWAAEHTKGTGHDSWIVLEHGREESWQEGYLAFFKKQGIQIDA